MSDFNPNEHLLQLKSKAGSQDYLPVQWRLVWFRSECPNGTIETEEVEVDLDRTIEADAYVWNAEKRRSEKVIKQAKGYARFRAVITDGKGGKATATGSEAAVDFGDYIEKAETKAIGRALAMLGYGTQFAPEFAENHRIVDAPVDNEAPRQPEPPDPAATTNQRLAPQHFTKVESTTETAQLQQEIMSLKPHHPKSKKVMNWPEVLAYVFEAEIKAGMTTVQKLVQLSKTTELDPEYRQLLEAFIDMVKASRTKTTEAA